MTLTERLQSKNTAHQLRAVEELSQSGEAKHLPLVFGLLQDTADEEVIGAITSLLGQLKQQAAVPYLAEAIADENLHDIREELLAACWENGLDYTAHLALFVDIMISADFMSAFEAHTVITNMSGKIAPEQREEEESKIADALLHTNAEKATLLQEVQDFLYALENGIAPAEY